MQATLALRKSSINSIAAVFAVLLAWTAGVAGGYLLKSQVPSAVTRVAQPPVAAQTLQPFHDMPESTTNVADAVDRAIAREGKVSRSTLYPGLRTGD
jgi:hypothetical protein